LNRALAFLAFAGLAALPRFIDAQGIPEALKDKALVVRVHAVIPQDSIDQGASPAPAPSQGANPGRTDSGQGEVPPVLGRAIEKSSPWQADSAKYAVPGTPVPFKLVGSNLAVILQVTPFTNEDGKGVTLIAQGQVWIKPPDGGFSYHTTVDTLSVDYGETVLFFPLGIGSSGKAALRLEISVLRAADLPSDELPAEKPAEKQADKSADKTGK